MGDHILLSLTPIESVTIKDGKPVTTSRIVAEIFEKNHFDVIKSIKNLECSKGFRGSNFAAAEFIDAQWKIRPEYEMTKDGFTFLVMGYTGAKAAGFKEAYIHRFNEMEELLRSTAQASKAAATLTWEQHRQGSKKVRAAFTDTLKEHDVTGFGFAQCTNGIYRRLFGGTAKQLKAKKGLKPKDLLRDAMSVEELAFTTVAEVVASQRMDLKEDRGNSPCYNTCKTSGEAVGSLLVKKLK